MRPRRQPRGRGRRASCESGKRRFPDKRAALSALHTAQQNRAEGQARRRECRVYRCGACRGWHMTSQPFR